MSFNYFDKYFFLTTDMNQAIGGNEVYIDKSIPVPFNYQWKWNGITWNLTELPEASLDELKADLKATITTYRYNLEVGGIIMADGTKILTDRESQAQLTSALTSLKNGLIDHIDWKAVTGWVELGLPEIEALATLVITFVQGCFTSERIHLTNVDAITTFDELAAYDYQSGWPDNDYTK